MSELTTQSETESRLMRIKTIINTIYNSVTTNGSSYIYTIPSVYEHTERVSDPFYIKNISDIISGLQEFFPNSVISHAVMAEGTDGKLYDISKLDSISLSIVNYALDTSYIIIDWS